MTFGGVIAKKVHSSQKSLFWGQACILYIVWKAKSMVIFARDSHMYALCETGGRYALDMLLLLGQWKKGVKIKKKQSEEQKLTKSISFLGAAYWKKGVGRGNCTKSTLPTWIRRCVGGNVFHLHARFW